MKKTATNPVSIATPFISSIARTTVSGIVSGVSQAINEVEREEAGVVFDPDSNKPFSKSLAELGLVFKYRNKPFTIVPKEREYDFVNKKIEELYNAQRSTDTIGR